LLQAVHMTSVHKTSISTCYIWSKAGPIN